MRLIAFAVTLLASITVSAATDLKLSFDGLPSQVRPGDVLAWTTILTNIGSETAERVVFSVSAYPGGAVCAETTVAALPPGAKHELTCTRVVTDSSYIFAVTARANGTNTRPVNAEARIDVITPPDMSVSLRAPKYVDAAFPFTLNVFAENHARTPATGVTVTIDFLVGGNTVTRLPEECRVAGSQVVCSLGDFAVPPAPGSKKSFAIEVLAPDQSRGSVVARASIAAAEGSDPDSSNNTRDLGVQTFVTFNVTNVADSGPGSLRAAILDAHGGACTSLYPCKIAFRIPPDGARWLTIRPASPLPVVSGEVLTIDGSVQSRYYGDTNPDGPEIEIDGSALSAGDGLVIRQNCVEVRGLTVNRFQGHGIVFRPGKGCNSNWSSMFTGVASCYLGTDPTGNTAAPNERGVFVDARVTYVSDSVISGNRRAGVFITDNGFAYVIGNTIGLNATRTAALGNGASGVYIARGARGSDVFRNYIGFNAHAGVALAHDAWWVELGTNSFQANWGLAVDYGLDGITASIPFVGQGPNQRIEPGPGTVSYPTIESAVYDAATDTTTIAATVPDTGPRTTYNDYTVHFYANDVPDPSGFGEGQYYLGDIVEGSSDRWILRLKGRPPGPWITATTSAHAYWGFSRSPDPDGTSSCGDCGSTWTSSEFSRAVRLIER